MKIALKYGLLITLGLIAWVVVAHLLVPDPRSPVHSIGAIVFFNLLEFIGIFLAINTKKTVSGNQLDFKSGIKTGMATAFVFVLTSCLFFLVTILIVGPEFMGSEPGAENLPLWKVAVGAFVGFGGFSLILCLVYSTVISFFLAKRQSAN